jgi:5-deoxy-glucuronate isomerase
MSWHRPSGQLRSGAADVEVTPDAAGWRYSGLQVFTLRASEAVRVELASDEAVVLPLSARDVTVTIEGTPHRLAGRDGVFAAVSDWLYAPLGATLTITGGSGDVAVCTSRASRHFPVTTVAAADVPVEVRGAGRATRQVTNIATPESFAQADRIIVCEVITPGGNWSSWPPHRHDGIADCPVANEEIYYFRIGRQETPHGDALGQGTFRVYTVDGSVDQTVTVGDGDVYLVPEGYHGPTVAPPEYPMYFLNVLAGPGEDRTMAFCDDPDHHWIRQSWSGQAQDPRLPVTSAAGRTGNG